MRPIRGWLVLFVAVAGASGCRNLHGPEPVPVLVRDAETGAPVGGAEVRIWDPATRGTGELHEASGVTGADGVARLRSAARGSDVLVEVSAPGYLAGQADLPAAAAVAAPGRAPAGAVVDVFAGPRPSVELIVPSGYRGLLKVEVAVAAETPPQPGQRQFRFAVPPDGVLRVTGPKVLGRLAAPDITAAYTDGTPIRRDAGDGEVGFRWVRCDGSDQYFAVGTRAECERYRRDAEREAQRQQGSAGSGGGGRGGGGRGHRGGGMGGGRSPGSMGP